MRIAHAALIIGLLLPRVAAAESTVRAYDIEGHGSLELEVPLRWKETLSWTADRRPVIAFLPEEGQSFAVTLQVLPPPADAPPEFGSPEWLRALVEQSARTSLGLAPDAELGLQQIGETAAVGWYYSVTDHELPDPPPAGAYRVMTQGASSAGGLVLTATLLTQKAWGEDANAGLRMLRTARVSDRPGDPWRTAGENDIARGALGDRYTLELPEDVEIQSRSPLVAEDRVTGGLLRIEAASREARPAVKDELRRLEQELERRSPGSWVTRRRGPALLDGKAAARLVAMDELRDELVIAYALPLPDAVLNVTWRSSLRTERRAEARVAEILEGFKLR